MPTIQPFLDFGANDYFLPEVAKPSLVLSAEAVWKRCFGNPFYRFSRNSCFHTASAHKRHSVEMHDVAVRFVEEDVSWARIFA